MSLYLNNESKIAGKLNEPIIIEKYIKYLRSIGYIVECVESSDIVNMTQKIDYYLIFDSSTPFNGFLKIAIDVKFAYSYTLISENGKNNIESSKSDYIIFNFPNRPDILLKINTNDLKECIKVNPPNLYSSKYGNSKYFYIEEYINKNKKCFEGKIEKIDLSVPYQQKQKALF